ncbi:hypothetical protein CC2G_007121 [Coprinopsis cinerea AmutBmut pab1-1]|nr:hypothetical protein CC2G_007121 [Coprinopsis cinerea AmutBmut pab1-1]
MSAFANLMALSASQTKQQESAVEMALRERQRKEALRRKQQEEKEAKEREMEKQRRLKLFEEQKKEEERRKRMEEAKAAKERALQRREEEERDRLLHGPKKAAKMASSSGGSKSADGRGGKRRGSDESDDDSGPVPLTREELRQRKQQMELKRLYGASKKASSSMSGGYHKPGRKLPGGAVDMTAPSTSTSPGGGSVKNRLAAMPNVLVKLNQVKRDTRTIDEILQDRARAKEGKVLEGDQALVFDDWFGTKKKETGKKPDQSRPSSMTPTSGTTTPSSQPPSSTLPVPKRANPAPKQYVTSKPAPPPRTMASSSSSRPSTSTRPPTADRAADRAKTAQSKPSKSSAHGSSYSSGKASSSATSKKRARSMSRSETPPPKRRHRSPVDSDDLDEDYSSAIWKLFGRDRSKYVSKDVFSDDEDMEADARALEREEKMRCVSRSPSFFPSWWDPILTLIFRTTAPALLLVKSNSPLRKKGDTRRRSDDAGRSENECLLEVALEWHVFAVFSSEGVRGHLQGGGPTSAHGIELISFGILLQCSFGRNNYTLSFPHGASRLTLGLHPRRIVIRLLSLSHSQSHLIPLRARVL